MAFTKFVNGNLQIITIDQTLEITPDPTTFDTEATPYFHMADIVIVSSQDEAVAVRMVNAKVKYKDNPEDEEIKTVECRLLIGITSDETNLDGPDNFAACPCPPFDHNGGIFMPTPLINL